MKRYGNLYHKIYDVENIKLAHKNARKGKSHYKEVQMVDADVDAYCGKVSELLKNKEFVNGKYRTYMKSDRGKQREIHKLPYFPDRIVHHAILQVLEPIWKKTLIDNTYQSIKGRGIHKAKKKLEPTIRSGKYKYYLKFDIAKFYPSVDNEIMKDVVRRKLKCNDTLWLLDEIIDSTKGLPIGNYLSQYLGNLYLAYFDHWVKQELNVKEYYRYCDDIVILGTSKKMLHNKLGRIRNYLGIMLNLGMKKDYRVHPIKSGLDFLGFRFFERYTLLRKKIATNFKRATRRFIGVGESEFDSMISYYGWAIASSGANLWNNQVNTTVVTQVKQLEIVNKIIGGRL